MLFRFTLAIFILFLRAIRTFVCVVLLIRFIRFPLPIAFSYQQFGTYFMFARFVLLFVFILRAMARRDAFIPTAPVFLLSFSALLVFVSATISHSSARTQVVLNFAFRSSLRFILIIFAGFFRRVARK